MNKLIFMCGIFGAGKSTLCKELSRKANIQCIKASSLIPNNNQQNGIAKIIENSTCLANNQALLISALQKLQLQQICVLEGHTCLLGSRFEIMRIPEETFSCIQPAGIIIITRSVQTVQKDLFKRDGVLYGLDVLTDFQRHECIYAEEISKNLSIPMLDINLSNESIPTSLKKVQNFIAKIGCKSVK